jgi:hypothetical protein
MTPTRDSASVPEVNMITRVGTMLLLAIFVIVEMHKPISTNSMIGLVAILITGAMSSLAQRGER